MKYQNPTTAQVAQIVACTEAEGPGKRFAIWFQGCPLRCPGCCNPEFLNFSGGTKTLLKDICDNITATHERYTLEGITLLGGEPLSHAYQALVLANHAHSLGLNVMAFTGYSLEYAQERPEDLGIKDLIKEIDILVDGPYIKDLVETKRRWIGSSNQRIHFLTERANANDPRWELKNTLEIRMENGEVSVNGFPALTAVGLWKRMGTLKR